jgi:hypothetical protein
MGQGARPNLKMRDPPTPAAAEHNGSNYCNDDRRNACKNEGFHNPITSLCSKPPINECPLLGVKQTSESLRSVPDG